MYVGMEILLQYLIQRYNVAEHLIGYIRFMGFMVCVAWSMAAAEAITPFLVYQSDNTSVQNLQLPIVFACTISIFGYHFGLKSLTICLDTSHSVRMY